MKKYSILILLVIAICLVTKSTFAFDDTYTHPAITAAAIQESVLEKEDYLKDNLGFEKKLAEEIANNPNDETKKIKINEIIINGARQEDSATLPPTPLCKRGLNHFYDPVNKKGLAQHVGRTKSAFGGCVRLIAPSGVPDTLRFVRPTIANLLHRHGGLGRPLDYCYLFLPLADFAACRPD